MLKNKVFEPLAMSGIQPTAFWKKFKVFDSGKVYGLTNSNELFCSKDYGVTWTALTTANPPPIINDFIETKDGIVYAGTEDGVYELKKFKDPTPTGCTDLKVTKSVSDKTICKNGALKINISGGSVPYSVFFKNEQFTTSDSLVITNLENGYYELDLVDKNGCKISTDFYVNYVVKESLQVTFNEKHVCDPSFVIYMLKGYAPYTVEYEEGGKKTTLVYEENSNPNSYTIARLTLDKKGTYNFTVKDQSGCSAFQSTQQGTSFKPVITYTGTEKCDSIDVGISIENSTFNNFRINVRRSSGSSILQSANWTGSEGKIRIPHDNYTTFLLPRPKVVIFLI